MNLLPERNTSRPGDDPIFALNREATQRKSRGETVINATVGALLEDDGQLAILPTVIDALHGVDPRKIAGYAPIAGVPDYLSAVTRDLLGSSPLGDMAVAASTPGGTGALRHAVSTFLDRGQSIVTPSFFWGPYQTICDENERGLRSFAMFDETGRFNVPALARCVEETAAAQGRLLIFLNDPCHNPTGYSMSDEEWTGVSSVLQAAAKTVPTAVLADVAYLAFARDTTSFLKHLEPLAERAAVLFAWSASKAFGLYGQRVGALIACTADPAQRTSIQNAMAYACRGTWSNCNAAGQHAVARCLSDSALDAAVRSERARLIALLDGRVTAFNREAKGTSIRYPRYDGGFFVTLFAADPRASAERLKERGVFVVPGRDSLRVALCSVPEAQVPALVSALVECVR